MKAAITLFALAVAGVAVATPPSYGEHPHGKPGQWEHDGHWEGKSKDCESTTVEAVPVYSTPAPAPVYSEPAPVYSEPAPVYSEPHTVYSEPAPVYSTPEPEPVYSTPAPEPVPVEPSYPVHNETYYPTATATQMPPVESSYAPEPATGAADNAKISLAGALIAGIAAFAL